MQFSIGSLLYAALTLGMLVLSLGLYRPASARERVTLAMLLCTTADCLATTLSLSISHMPLAYILAETKYLFLPAAIVLCLLLYSYFLDIRKLRSKKAVAALICAAALAPLTALTNPLHGSFMKSVSQVDEGGTLMLVFENGAAFIWTLLPVYFMVFLGVLLLFKAYLNKPRMYREQLGLVLLADLSAICVAFYLTFFADTMFTGLLTPVFAIVAAVNYRGILKYKPLRMMTLVRRKIVGETHNPILMFDDRGLLIFANGEAETLFSLTPHDYSVTSEQSFLRLGLRLPEFSDKCGAYDKRELSLAHPDGVRYYILRDDGFSDKKGRRIGRLFVLNDVTDIKRASLELEWAASHDPLTGFLTRPVFVSRMADLRPPVSFVCVNLDGMKILNDVFGYSFGDRVIQEVGGIIGGIAPDRELISRPGGDEFLIALPDTGYEAAGEFVERLKKACSFIEPLELSVSVSCGYDCAASDDSDVLEAFRNSIDHMFKSKLVNINSARSSLLSSLIHTMHQNESEPEEHAERTRNSALLLGKKLGLKQSELDDLALLTQLHDVGKISLSYSLLSKRGPLTAEEWEYIHLHTVKGYKIALSTPELSSIAYAILSHHERYDGTGYPNRLKGEEIPILSRIIMVVDAFDVMMNDRPYRKAKGLEYALKELREHSGTQFDPEIAKAFIELLDEYPELAQRNTLFGY